MLAGIQIDFCFQNVTKSVYAYNLLCMQCPHSFRHRQHVRICQNVTALIKKIKPLPKPALSSLVAFDDSLRLVRRLDRLLIDADLLIGLIIF